MLLLLMRHGVAEPQQLGHADADRPLTPQGRAVLAQQAVGLARLHLPVDRLCCSAYRRARETAALIGPAVQQTPEIFSCLKPGATLDDMTEVWEAVGRPARWMIVGHQPSLGTWLWHLTGAQAALPPGSLALIEAPQWHPGRGTLIGLYAPAFLARLSSTT